MPKTQTEKTFLAKDERTGELREFPKEPTMWDQVKESFEAAGTRANVDATRKMYQKTRSK